MPFLNSCCTNPLTDFAEPVSVIWAELYLPEPNEIQYLTEIEKELELVKQYL